MAKFAYKLFKTHDGKLFPLYVNAQQETPIGTWLQAVAGQKADAGHVKSKLGPLAYRPGWHMASLPVARHIGKKSAGGGLVQAKDTVWCLVEIAGPDITEQAHEMGYRATKKGVRRWAASRACFTDGVHEGWYRYRTNTNADPRLDWIIAGQIKVVRTLTPEEVRETCWTAGIEPQAMEE